MTSLGISIIAHNEEHQISRAIKSSLFADDIVVVNCESIDNTRKVAESFEKVRIFDRPNNKNLNINKSFGFEQLETDWIFYLDPDEVIPAELSDEILQVIKSSENNAYKLPRKNYFFSHWLAYGSQYPDIQLRLFKRGFARFENKHVHEMLKVDGKIGMLRSDFEHHPYPTVNDYIRKMNFYTSFQAEYWHKSESGPGIGKKDAVNLMFIKPFVRFIRRYFFKRGFKDGWPGFVAASGDFIQNVFSYAKYLELKRKDS